MKFKKGDKVKLIPKEDFLKICEEKSYFNIIEEHAYKVLTKVLIKGNEIKKVNPNGDLYLTGCDYYSSWYKELFEKEDDQLELDFGI